MTPRGIGRGKLPGCFEKSGSRGQCLKWRKRASEQEIDFCLDS